MKKRKRPYQTIRPLRNEDPQFFDILPHPSNITSTPHYPITIKLQLKLMSRIVHLDDIYYQLSKKFTSSLLFNSVPSISLRILQVRTWSLNSTPYILGTYPFITNYRWGNVDIRNLRSMWNKTVYPSLNHFGSIGFKWPKSHQQVSFYTDLREQRNVPLVSIISERTSVNILIYFDILWTFNQADMFMQPVVLSSVPPMDRTSHMSLSNTGLTQNGLIEH